MLLDEDYLSHYGIMRRSGRYPWGSGELENTRNKSFLDYAKELSDQGLSEKEIAQGMGMTTREFRDEKSHAKNAQKQANVTEAQRLKDKGYGPSEIGRRMGHPESTVRTWLAPGAKDKADNLRSITDMLKKEVDEKRFIDVGSGVENTVGITKSKLGNAVSLAQKEGYPIHYVKTRQVSGGKFTNQKVLGYPGSKQKEIFMDPMKIKLITDYSEDGGRTFYSLHPPLQIDQKRLAIVYGEDGGGKADGMIYVRPGVKDVDLGGTNYAQVRVMIGDSHYIKGMAIYKEGLPEGTDLQFHTKKENTGNKLDAIKAVKDDPENPFGSFVRQVVADHGLPTEHVTSAMNKVNEEGQWHEWSRNLSTQMLSKQDPRLAKAQLNMTYEGRKNELAAINALQNATVRKKLLEEFAEGTAAASVHMKAAQLPRQGVHVILPLSTIPPTQVYAPNYLPGESVVLIRHPHGGKFEIPELIVNNNNAEGKRLLGKSIDAIGIHHETAKRLSGADFDGDTVIVIPNNQGKVKIAPAIKSLQEFDPIASYPKYDGMKVMSNTQSEMGMITNLITDMSLQRASVSEITRAVKHSMVVIDAENHQLNYKQSYNDHNIKDLKQKYQGSAKGGAATLISRARAKKYVPQRKERSIGKGGPIDLATGERMWEPTGRKSYKTGELLKTRSTKLAEARSAHELVSSPAGTTMERIYADHSDKLRAMANEARLTAATMGRSKSSPSAKKGYAAEVESLNANLDLALKKRPLERQANIIAQSKIKARRAANPNMDEDTLNKIRYQSLEEARVLTGSKKSQIKISDKEWDAIQAGAISDSKLREILNNADMDIVREHATPSTAKMMTSAKTNRAKQMLGQGYTRAYVARQLGVSLSTLDEATT